MVGPTGLSDANRLGYTHRGLPEGAPHAIFHRLSFINNNKGREDSLAKSPTFHLRATLPRMRLSAEPICEAVFLFDAELRRTLMATASTPTVTEQAQYNTAMEPTIGACWSHFQL